MINYEEQHLYISGVIRPPDIAMDNSVDSSLIADARVEFTGRGDIDDRSNAAGSPKFSISSTPSDAQPTRLLIGASPRLVACEILFTEDRKIGRREFWDRDAPGRLATVTVEYEFAALEQSNPSDLPIFCK